MSDESSTGASGSQKRKAEEGGASDNTGSTASVGFQSLARSMSDDDSTTGSSGSQKRKAEEGTSDNTGSTASLGFRGLATLACIGAKARRVVAARAPELLVAGGCFVEFTPSIFDDGLEGLFAGLHAGLGAGGAVFSVLGRKLSEFEALEEEHLSRDPFKTSDGIATTPYDEWCYVVHDVASRKGDERKGPYKLGDFAAHPTCVAAGLSRAEVAALRLQTGPLGELYKTRIAAAVNRGAASFVSTALLVNSAVGKLMGLWSGKSGQSEALRIVHPEELMFESVCTASPRLRFIDMSFMRGSSSREKLLSFRGAGTKDTKDDHVDFVLEVNTAKQEACADVSWVSQNPDVYDLLFPAVSALWLTGHQRVEGATRLLQASVICQPQYRLVLKSAMKTGFLKHARALCSQFSARGIPPKAMGPLVDCLEHFQSKEGPWFDIAMNLDNAHSELSGSYSAVLGNLSDVALWKGDASESCLQVACFQFSLGKYASAIEVLEARHCEGAETEASALELLGQAYEMQQQALPLDKQESLKLSKAVEIYSSAVAKWKEATAAAPEALRVALEIKTATSLWRHGGALARSCNMKSIGFNDEVKDIPGMLEEAEQSVKESIDTLSRLKHSSLPFAIKSMGMVHHNRYRTTKGYSYGKATGPAHGKVGDEAFRCYDESAQLFEGQGCMQMDHAESLTCCGSVFDDRGQAEKGLIYRLRSAIVQEVNFGVEHPKSKKYRNTLATTLDHAKRSSEAALVRSGGKLLNVDPASGAEVVSREGSCTKEDGALAKLLSTVTEAPTKSNFYICFDREQARDLAVRLKDEFEQQGFKGTWAGHDHCYNRDEENELLSTPFGSQELASTLAGSEKVVLILTSSVVAAPLAKMELRIAIGLKKHIHVVYEEDERKSGSLPLADLKPKLALLPELEVHLARTEAAFMHLSRTHFELHALIGKLAESPTHSTRNLLVRRAPPLPGGCKWHFFLSHFQENSQDQCHSLSESLEALGYSVWYDNKMPNVIETGMLEGVEKSAVFVLFLNDRTLTREFVQLELRHALKLKKKISLIHEMDGRHGAPLTKVGAWDVGTLIAQTPEDLRFIFKDHESVPYQRRTGYREVLLNQLAKSLRESQ